MIVCEPSCTGDSLKLGFHIRGKRKRVATAACGCGMRYANDLIPYIRLPMRLHSLLLNVVVSRTWLISKKMQLSLLAMEQH